MFSAARKKKLCVCSNDRYAGSLVSDNYGSHSKKETTETNTMSFQKRRFFNLSIDVKCMLNSIGFRNGQPARLLLLTLR